MTMTTLTPTPETMMTERDRITEQEHRIGQATEEAESMAMEGGAVRECALRFLGALEVPESEWPAERPTIAAEPSEEASPSADTSRALTGSHESGQPHSGVSLPVAVPDREAHREAISAAIDDGWWGGPKPSERVMEIIWPMLADRADGSTVRLCPTCLHDGVLERTLERARAAAEGKLAAIERQCGKAAGVLRRGTGVPFSRQDVMVDARYILEIIGTGGDEGDG